MLLWGSLGTYKLLEADVKRLRCIDEDECNGTVAVDFDAQLKVRPHGEAVEQRIGEVHCDTVDELFRKTSTVEVGAYEARRSEHGPLHPPRE